MANNRLLTNRLALARAAVIAAVVVTLAACSTAPSDEGFSAPRALLSDQDVPSEWTAVSPDEFPFSLPSPLLDLLFADSTVSGAFSVFRDSSGLRGASSLVVLNEDRAPFLADGVNVDRLKELAPLLIEQERLVRLTVGGAGAPIHLALTDVPREGSLRTRSVLEGPSGESIFSDSILFSEGPVLATVTVQFLENEGPFMPVEDLAVTVYQRVLEELARLP
jgi:hypothetical protein